MRQRQGAQLRIAVIGAGAAGLSAAWMLSKYHETVLFEAGNYLGGHANTIDVDIGGRRFPVDTGFIVYNEPNYPNLTRLFDVIGAETEPSDMSFSVSIGDGRLEYYGSPAGLFAQPSNLFRPDHWRMLHDIRRFSLEAPQLLAAPADDPISLGQMLERGGYSKAFAREYLLPMAAAIWSSTLEGILRFPALSFIQFFANHGLLNLKEALPWRTLRGGSRTYVARLVETGYFEARTGSEAHAVARTSRGVEVHSTSAGAEQFDQVVFATPADRTLAILGAGASQLERRLLGSFRYQPNRAVVHGDQGLMPKRRRAWASWNYLAQANSSGLNRVSVSYWMNNLQSLPVPEPVIVSLNPIREPAADSFIAEFLYQHPQFDRAAVEAQRQLPAIQGVARTWFCGSYCGYGFHEDAVQSGLSVAAALGTHAPWADKITPRSPAALAVGGPLLVAAE